MVPATPTQNALEIERVLVQGDIGKMPPEMRLEYYRTTCESLGLNPLTKPFEYLTLQGKTILYAKKDATDQLRKIHGVSINIVSREVLEGVYIVTARGTDKHGRQDESIGALPLPASPVERANAIMKCETKAKRRVTLSICGLGMLDETELETIGSKEAQQEYLRSKGIEPAPPKPSFKKAETHICEPSSDVRLREEQHKALIIEGAKMLDEPPQGFYDPPTDRIIEPKTGTKTIEMRHAATVAEADAALKEVAKPKKAAPKITADSIEIRKGMTNMKDMLRAVTGDDTIYYDVLKSHGYASSAEIPTREIGRRIYLKMGEIHTRLVDEKKLRAELELVEHMYHDQFYNIMGNHGCEVIEDALALTSEPLEALRVDLKRLGGAA